MTASRPTAASATDVSPGGMLISSRLGSTIRPGRSTVSSRVRNACHNHQVCLARAEEISSSRGDCSHQSNGLHVCPDPEQRTQG